MEPRHCLCDLVQPSVSDYYARGVRFAHKALKERVLGLHRPSKKGLFLWTLCHCMFCEEAWFCMVHYLPVHTFVANTGLLSRAFQQGPIFDAFSYLSGKASTEKEKFLDPPPLVQLPAQDQVQLVEARFSTQQNLPAKLCRHCKMFETKYTLALSSALQGKKGLQICARTLLK